MILMKPTLRQLLYLCDHARPDEIEQHKALVGRDWDPDAVASDHFHRRGVSLALLSKQTGLPVAAAGYDEQLEGVWAAWMVGTPEGWQSHWRSITKAARKVGDRLLDDGARRLQLLVLESREKTCEWYERGLRMRREGEMKAYGLNGETAVMYARTQGDRHG